MRATWLADVLRNAGCEVVTYRGWETRSNGTFTDLTHVVWHHDASAPGDSPSIPQYMIGNYSQAGAQCWVDRQGRWHVIAAGVAYHAGKVMDGKPGNRQSIGVETDHTTGERWPSEQLNMLRIGTAAILRHLGRGKDGLEFHKTICSPPGRKSDPDGLSLLDERRAIGVLLAEGHDDMQADEREWLGRVHHELVSPDSATNKQLREIRDALNLIVKGAEGYGILPTPVTVTRIAKKLGA